MLLVTGITGHSGKYFLQELIDQHYAEPMRCIVRTSSDTSQIDGCNLDIEKAFGDLEDDEFLEGCMQNVDTILHIYNIHYTIKMMQAAVKHNVKSAILVHTAAVHSKFKQASIGYDLVENELQKMITEGGNKKIAITILRPTMIYGDVIDRNMSTFIKLADQVKLFPVINLSIFLANCLKICTFKKVDYVEKVQRMGEDRSFSHKEATEDFSYQPRSFKNGIKREVLQYISFYKNK